MTSTTACDAKTCCTAPAAPTTAAAAYDDSTCDKKMWSGWLQLRESKATMTLQPDGKDICKCECKGENASCVCRSQPFLFFFDARGGAEAIRLMFWVGGKRYIDVRLPHDEFNPTWKAHMPFGQVPLLMVEGNQLAQSRAIEHYVAAYTGLNGRDPLEQAQIDMVIEGVRDMIEAFDRIFMPVFGDEKKQDEAVNKYMKEEWDTRAGYLDKLLGDKTYFVGGRLTHADLVLFCWLNEFMIHRPDTFKQFPTHLAAFYERMNKLPKIAEWLKVRPVTKH